MGVSPKNFDTQRERYLQPGFGGGFAPESPLRGTTKDAGTAPGPPRLSGFSLTLCDDQFFCGAGSGTDVRVFVVAGRSMPRLFSW